jgi:hypothetical protein
MNTASLPPLTAFQKFAEARFKELGSPHLALPPKLTQVWSDNGYAPFADVEGLLRAIGTNEDQVRQFLECMGDFASRMAEHSGCTDVQRQFALSCALVAIERLWGLHMATLWPQGPPAQAGPTKIHVADPDSSRLCAALASNTGLLLKAETSGGAVVLNHLHDLPDAEYRYGSRLHRIYAALTFQTDLLLGRKHWKDKGPRLKEMALSGPMDAKGLQARLELLRERKGGLGLAFVLGPDAPAETGASLRAEFAQLQALGVSVVEYGTQAVADEVVQAWRSLAGAMNNYLRPSLELIQTAVAPTQTSTSPVITRASIRPKVFFSYAHKDAGKWLEMVKLKLRVQETAGKLDVWGDWDIRSSEVWDYKIRDAVATADVALVLLSDHFFDSRYIQNDEWPAIKDRFTAGGLRIITVVLSRTRWEDFPWFAAHQIENPGRAVSSLPDAECDQLLDEIMPKLSQAAPHADVANTSV